MAGAEHDPEPSGDRSATDLPVRADLEITETDGVVAAFESMYGMDNVRFDEAPPRWAISSVADARTSLARIEVGGATRLHSAPVEGLFVVHVEQGAYRPILDGFDRTFTAGQVFTLPPGRPWLAVTPGMLENVLFLPPDRVASIAADVGAPLLPHLATRVAVADPARFRPMATLWSEMVSVLTRSDLYRSPLVFDSAYRNLVVSVLRAFDALGEPVAPRGSARTVRRALEVMHARISEPLTVADIAEELRVSERTLHAAFRSALGVAPMRHLRSLRLEAVRQELLRAEPGEVLIQDVARRFGFAQLGRFAGEYRRAFEELPSDTLSR